MIGFLNHLYIGGICKFMSNRDTYTILGNVKGDVSNSTVNVGKTRDVERKAAAAHKLEYPSEQDSLEILSNEKGYVKFPYGSQLVTVPWLEIARANGYSDDDIKRLETNFKPNVALFKRGLLAGTIELENSFVEFDELGIPHAFTKKRMKACRVGIKQPSKKDKKKRGYAIIHEIRAHKYAELIQGCKQGQVYHHKFPWFSDWIQGSSLLCLERIEPSEHAKRTKILSKLENDIIIYLNKNYRKQNVPSRNSSVRIENKHIA